MLSTCFPTLAARSGARSFAAIAIAVGLSGTTRLSSAQQPSAPAPSHDGPGGLEYTAPPECPSKEDWLNRVRTRRGDDTSFRSGEALARISASVTVSPSGKEARIAFDDGTERWIVGSDCEEVASATALILAVALGSGAPGPTPPVSDSPAQSSSLPAAPIEPAARDEGASGLVTERTDVADRTDAPASTSEVQMAPVPPRAAPNGRDVRADPAPVPPPSRKRVWSIALGANAETNDWIGPGPALAFGMSIDTIAPARNWSARFAAMYGTSERSMGQRRAEFAYGGFHIDLCPLALGSMASWRWTNCGEAHLGLQQASGDERSLLATSSPQRALLATLVAASRLQTPALWSIRFELEAGLSVPLLRQTFQFEAPVEEVFHSPIVGLVGRAGIRVPFDGQVD